MKLKYVFQTKSPERRKGRTNVAFGADSENGSEELGVGATLLELHLSEMLDGVSVGEDSPPGDDEATATRAVLPLSLPRQREVRLRVHAENLHHRVHGRNHPGSESESIPFSDHHVDKLSAVLQHPRRFPPLRRLRLVGIETLLRAAAGTVIVDGGGAVGGVDELDVADGENVV